MARKRTPSELISESITGYDRLERELRSAIETRDSYKKQISTAKGKITRKRNSPYPDKLFEEIVNQMRTGDVLSNLLIFEIDQATEENDEFARSAYKAALYGVARQTEIFKFFKIGQGWFSGLNVQIIFEEAAGTLSDWARGIRVFREELKIKQGDGRSRAGFRATNWWLTNVWGTGLEVRTIHGRLEASGRAAPFWQILNNGSQPLESDRRDGSYNPIPAMPTDFIGNAESRIRTLFLSSWLPEKIKWQEETQQLQEEIERYQERVDEYDREVDQLTTNLIENQRIYNSFGEKKQFIDKNKLDDVVRRLRAGEEFERPQVELTRSGSQYRVRVSVKKVEGLIND